MKSLHDVPPLPALPAGGVTAASGSGVTAAGGRERPCEVMKILHDGPRYRGSRRGAAHREGSCPGPSDSSVPTIFTVVHSKQRRLATMTADSGWTSRIAELVLVKQALAEVDERGLWPHHLPGLAATEAELLAVETSIGEALSSSHRAFLLAAGGWRGFFQSVDLFGPNDFLGSERWTRGASLLRNIDDAVLEDVGFPREHVLPLAASSGEIDLFVIARRASSSAGVVVWFAGDEVERFANFGDYFAAMVDYNRREVRKMAEIRDAPGGQPRRPRLRH